MKNTKIAVIPGASRPIGRAIARKFGREGMHLILPVYDWPESIVEMEKEFAESEIQCTITRLDLRAQEEVALFSQDIKDQWGHVDYLINNIERGGMPVVHGSYDKPHNKDQWDLEVTTTMKSKWLLYHHLSPIMKARSGGAVINLSSIASQTGRSGSCADLFNDGYSAANSAVRVFTETWAREAAPAVRVNEIMMGLFQGRHAEGTRGWPELSEGQREAILDTILLGRTGVPEELAELVFFIATQATYMTGAVILFDGGLNLGHSKVPPIPSGIL